MAAENNDTPPPASRVPEDALLLESVLTLWRRRWFVLVVTLLSGTAGLLWSLSRPPVYQARGTVLVGDAKYLETVIVLLKNRMLVDRVIGTLSPDESFSSAAFAAAVTVTRIPQTQLLQIQLELPDQDAVAPAVNTLSTAVSDYLTELEGQRAESLEPAVTRALERLTHFEAEVVAFKQESWIELRRRDGEALLRQRGRLLETSFAIEAERARLSRAEAELADRQRILTVKRSIDSDPVMLETMQRLQRSSDGLLDFTFYAELLDPVYQTLEETMAESRTNLAALEREHAGLLDLQASEGREVKALADLYEQENVLAELQQNLDIAKTVYVDLATRYEGARTEAAARVFLVVVDPAIRPAGPLSARSRLSLLVGLVIGFASSAVIVSILGQWPAIVAVGRDRGGTSVASNS